MCQFCNGSGIIYCFDDAGVGIVGFPVKPNWVDKTYPIVFAEDQEPRTRE